MISDVEHLVMFLLPPVCLLWKNVYSGPLFIFKLDYLCMHVCVELCKFFVYFGF